MIRLTKNQADKIGYLKITDWYAIQPIEIKDGTFILPKEVIQDIESFGVDIKIEISDKVSVSVLDDLKEKPIIKLLPAELKTDIIEKPVKYVDEIIKT